MVDRILIKLVDMDDDRGKQIMTEELEEDVAYEWTTDDDLEFELAETQADQGRRHSPRYPFDTASSSSSSSPPPDKIGYFVRMGFDEKMVRRAIDENGEENDDAILNSILTYTELEKSPGEALCSSSRVRSPSEVDSDDDLLESDSTSEDDRESIRMLTDKDATIATLSDMDYQFEDILSAIEKCGSDAPIEVLVDFISAAEFEAKTNTEQVSKKRKILDVPKILNVPKRPSPSSLHLPNPMIGFGVPGFNSLTPRRYIPSEAVGPPFFYYENVALTPKGVWQQISESLYGIMPEFVDSLHFSAAARKRGYIHNLPIDNRHPLLPIPPQTIHEALPDTRVWWPSWDKRTKLGCLLTCMGSAQLTERIKKCLQSGELTEEKKKYVIVQCRKWNLVWVGKNKVAVLEPEEMESLLGFPKYHTRGISRTDRYKALGNSFQIDTVAYHLSVLKPMYSKGINVLSLFSGIGGAEVALDRLGIHLKTVVSVEMSSVSRQIVQDWWNQTGQTGKLIHLEDVQKVTSSMIECWIEEFGGFDLVIGGSPCNNLAGGNRRTRDGLEGEQSSLFYQYLRILRGVMSTMRRRRG